MSERIVTDRLVLEPLAPETAQAVVEGRPDGLAEPVRGRGLASEFVAALAQHLLARPGVRRVVARAVLADNIPSRRALERAGFRLEREERGLTWYALAGDA